MACYEKYHWTPETIKALPLSEAYRLAVYFEEEARHTHKQMKDTKHAASSSGESGFERPGVQTRTVMELNDGEDEEWLFEEEIEDE